MAKSYPNRFNDLCFFICWYDDIGIVRTLGLLPKEAHKIVVDGKFKDYDDIEPLSHPLLRDKVLSYDNVTLIDAPNLLEHEKRNIYLQRCTQKYGFIIDSDEYIEYVDWDKVFEAIAPLDTDLRGVYVKHHTNQGHHQIPPRIIINPNQWEYYKTHWLFRRKRDGFIPRSADQVTFLDISLIEVNHNHDLRSREQMEKHDEYNAILREYENDATTAYLNHTIR